MDLLDFRPSEWQDLKTQIKDPAIISEVTTALAYFLNTIYDDWEDIYEMAVMISNTGFWNVVDLNSIKEIIATLDDDKAQAFLDGVPKSVRSSLR